ncbi:MAG: small multi-drug export protein [Firmicutes bacterium]|nr:small multi-drug export protein [Bacillota bacterium]MBQ9604813.1 small multi-drug export protein [Bacillota bacterium]
MNELIKQVIAQCSGLPDILTLMIISIMPMFGIRGGMIASYFLQTPVITAIFSCIAGNFIPVPFIFLFGRRLKGYMKQKHLFHNAIERLEQKADKNGALIEKYGFWGIILFIALPLPGTGSYMGAFIASVSRLSVRKAMTAIVCGMLLSGTIMGIIVRILPAV